ncbi:HTH_48 domain-containing protein [Trichonephila clavata]|uniref:HTH_48 domain-containing protein n=1 Tax=Trichonephila clavata TaxID=2740835 RepID=A0A8X6KSL7_TRICU|nr:HTH_48 domain-containing protein [Trichonephila clavata]
MVTQKLGYRKFCARWVPKLLTDHPKGQRMGADLTFLEADDRHGDSLLDRIVTGDETWIRHPELRDKMRVHAVRAYKFPQKTKKMFANLASKED